MKYTGKFKNIKDELFQVDIVTNNDTTQMKELKFSDNPCVISQSSSDGVFSPIKSRSCTVTVVTEEPLFDIFTTNSVGTSLTVINITTGDYVFNGYVTPCQYNQSYLYLNELEIEAVDALSVLQNYRYINTTLVGDYLELTQLLIVICNNYLSYLSQGQIGYTHLYFDNSIRTSQQYPIKIDVTNFIDQEMTFYDVLSEVCKFYGITVIPEGRNLYFIDYTKITAGVPTYTLYDLLTSQTKTISINSKIELEDYAGDDQNIEIDEVYNHIKVNCEVNEIDKEIIEYSSEDDFVEPKSRIIRNISVAEWDNTGQQTFVTNYSFDIRQYFSTEESKYSDNFKLVQNGVNLNSYKTKYFYTHLVGALNSTEYTEVTITHPDQTTKTIKVYSGTFDESNFCLPDLYGSHIQIIDKRSQIWTYYDLFATEEEAESYVPPEPVPGEIHEGAITSFELEPNVPYTLLDDYGTEIIIVSNAVAVPTVIAASYGYPQIVYDVTNQFIANTNPRLYKWAQYQDNNLYNSKLEWNNMFVLSAYTQGCTDGRTGTWGELQDKIVDDFIAQHYNDNDLGTTTVGYFNLKQLEMKSVGKITGDQPVDSYIVISGNVFLCGNIIEDFASNKQYTTGSFFHQPHSTMGRKHQLLGFDCLRCSIKIGNKYYYPNGTDETKWSTTPNIFALPICENDLTWYGWVDMTNTVNYNMNIGDEKGYAVKIPAGVALDGQIELTFYTPTIPCLYYIDQPSVVTELHTYKDLPNLVLLKDFKLKYIISGEEERESADEDDVTYENETETNNVISASYDIDLKINTYTNKKPQAKSNVMRQTQDGLMNVEDCVSADSSTRQEIYLINKYLGHYDTPKIIYNCVVHGYKKPFEQVISNAIGAGKYMIVDEQEYNVKADVNELKLIQY